MRTLTFLIFFPFICLGQDIFEYWPVSANNYFSDTSYVYLYKERIRNIKENGFRVERALPNGYVKDGSEDYTKYIQDVLDKHRYVIFPPFPLFINKMGITFKSDTHVLFEKGSKIYTSSSANTSVQALRIWNASNVSLFFPDLDGKRKHRRAGINELDVGIYIFNAHNVVVFSPRVNSVWGDAIYISGSDEPSSNIQIFNAVCDENRRNAISVINVRDLRMINVLATNTHGIAPMSGIDIEPNKSTNVIDNLYLKNIFTVNNKKAGLKIQLRRLLRENTSPTVNIQIINHISLGSQISFALAPVLKVKNAFSGEGAPIKGHIIIEKPKWLDYTLRPLNAWSYGTLGPQVTIESPVIRGKHTQQGRKLHRSNQTDGLNIKSVEYLKSILKKETKIDIRL